MKRISIIYLKSIGSVSLLSAILILFISLSGCKQGKAPADKPVLAVSYDAQKYILEQIAGPDYEIKVLLPPGSDPEMYEPDMRTMSAIEDADLYFSTFTLGFEDRMATTLSQNYPDLKILNVSTGIDEIKGTHTGMAEGVLGNKYSSAGSVDGGHSHGHAHVTDPHLMTSIGNIRIIAKNMLTGLSNQYPDDKEAFQKRYDVFNDSLQAYSHRLDSIMAPLRGKSFVVMHPAMSYFARDYGMHQVSLEKDGKEASPRQLRERLDEAASAQPLVLFYEKGHGDNSAASMASQLGISAHPINFEGADFLQEIESAARVLQRK